MLSQQKRIFRSANVREILLYYIQTENEYNKITTGAETVSAVSALSVGEARLYEIMYVTSECAPFIKTGGLGDVAGSLPQALAARTDVRVFCPLYSAIDQSMREKFYYIKKRLRPSGLAQPVLRYLPL